MTEHDTGVRIPLTPDEELLGADRPTIESLHTDAERLERMRAELETGFAALEGTRGVSVFGSARVPARTSPTTRSARASARALGEAGLRVITGGGPGLMEAANRGARDAGARSIGLNIELPFEQFANRLPRPLAALPLLLRAQGLFVRYASGVRRPARRLRDARRAVRGARAHPDATRSATSRSCSSAADFWGPLVDWIGDRLVGERHVAPRGPRARHALTDDPEEARGAARRGGPAQGGHDAA